MIEKKTLKIIKKKVKQSNKKIICIDGLTCSGKTYFSKLLHKQMKNTKIVSKDLFLYSRSQRIKLIPKLSIYSKQNQNHLHYNQSKLNLLLSSIKNKKKVILKNLYNRKNGKNDIKIIFDFRKTNVIIFEGLYSLENIKYFENEIYSILIYENIYYCLIRKIKRIRDKKISIQNVITEFTNLHLNSFLNYLKKFHFDLNLKISNNKFVFNKLSKRKQILLIKSFQNKHSYKERSTH